MRRRRLLLLLASLVAGASCGDSYATDPLAPEIPGDENGSGSESEAPQERFTMIRAGYSHTCALDAAGAAYCWGSNVDGKLGDGTTTDRSLPTPVVGGHTFVSIGVGETHTCGLRADGAAYCWGANMRGQLGDGNAPPPPERFGPVQFETVPTAVAGAHAFDEIAVGLFHVCALEEGGTAWCWGANESGQLGDGSFADRDVPTAVGGNLRFAALEAGGMTCGLASDGLLYCWGRDPVDCECEVVPTLVATELSFASVAVALHVCGLSGEGSAHCWGENVFGQLGDGSNVNRGVPTPVAGGHSFTSLSAELSSTCALAPGGEAYCWGSNPFGQVGNGEAGADVRAPMAVSGGLRFESISAGRLHTCAIDDGGVAHCWGWNTYGQLGDGTTESRSLPGAVLREPSMDMEVDMDLVADGATARAAD